MKSFHLLLALPVIALIGTPFFPFVNTADPWFGLPAVVVWVSAWCVITSLILAWMLRAEERAGRLSHDPDAVSEAEGEWRVPGAKGGPEA
ncbi:hypothetical protein [Parasphingorhabdus pacifica]